MKNNKYLRVLVCLVLVCCLCINTFRPVKASASALTWFAHQIDWDVGSSAILKGLGIARDVGSSDNYFNDLITSIKNAAADAGLVTNDLMDVYYQVDPLGVSSPLFAIPATLINFVRNWVFDNHVVLEVPYSLTLEGHSISCASPINYFVSECYDFSSCKYKRSIFIYSTDVPFVDGSHTGGTAGPVDGVYYPYSTIFLGYFDRDYSIFEGNSAYPDKTVVNYITQFGYNSSVYSDYPLSLGYIPPSSTLFNVAYPQWLEHERTLEDGTTETMVQIGLGNTQEETESLTQEQIWSGQGTMTVPEQGTTSDTVTLPGWLQNGIENLRLGLQDILSTLISLPAAIAEKLAAVFIPSTDYITAKVEALRGEFGFIDSVIATGEFIRDSVSGSSGPPVIYVDLGRAPSGNYGSQKVLLTDFSWYAPYKGQVDTVLSAALWAFFGWRVFLKLPGIIGGESGYISDVFFSSSSGRSGSDDKKKGGKG